MKEAKAMIKAGFRVDREPYLKSILLCIRAHLLQVRRVPPSCKITGAQQVHRFEVCCQGLHLKLAEAAQVSSDACRFVVK